MDVEGVERIQDTLVDLEAKFRKVKQLVDELMQSDQAKHNTLDDLQGLMSSIQSTIVTKEYSWANHSIIIISTNFFSRA